MNCLGMIWGSCILFSVVLHTHRHTLWEIETLSSEKQTVLLGCFVVFVDIYILTAGVYDYICMLRMYGAVYYIHKAVFSIMQKDASMALTVKKSRVD